MMEITAQQYLVKLKEVKSYIKRSKRIISNPRFWPANKFHDISKYFKLGKNVVGYLSLLQTTNFSIPKIRCYGDKNAPYRALTAIDRAIIGQHIILCIDKRNGKTIVCHTYETSDLRNPIKPLNVAINELALGIETGKIPRSEIIKLDGACNDGYWRWPAYRIAEFNNDSMSYPTLFTGGYLPNEKLYEGPYTTNSDDIVTLLDMLDRYIRNIKEGI